MKSVAGEEELVGSWGEDGRGGEGGLRERETFGVEEGELESKEEGWWSGGGEGWMGGWVGTRARRGKPNGRQTAEDRDVGANDRQWEQQRKNRRKSSEGGEKKRKKSVLPTPYLLFSIKLIFFFFSNGSFRSRLGGTSIPITMLPTHTAQ